MVNKHQWNWFYAKVTKEAKCFYGVEIKFIYCGVIITDMYGNNRAEFCGDDFTKLFDSVQLYLIRNFKRKKVIVHIKGGMYGKQ